MIAHMLLVGSKNFILMGIQHEKKLQITTTSGAKKGEGYIQNSRHSCRVGGGTEAVSFNQ